MSHGHAYNHHVGADESVIVKEQLEKKQKDDLEHKKDQYMHGGKQKLGKGQHVMQKTKTLESIDSA